MPRAFDVAFAIVAAASAIAAVTPTPRDDALLGKVYRILDTLALNVGYAKDRPKSLGGRFVAE
ncbi:hypothetical protein G5B40_03055 [Pikeienuella piscinae]|uniref:Uncharacterized protein n=2 Tax=Pikeienuella piscinae TaxID=2748098 RepID=A0A7M3T6V0_9RHOB|nr:hypothetical protein G5B40_03055 [Pikeienuella piscinae]